MSAREVVAFAYSMVTDGRTATEREELEEWLTTEPGEYAASSQEQRLEAIARMGGLVHVDTASQEQEEVSP
jgi:predicted membrane chloride channel (bestrophin family)